jgi:hypothetical protein
MGTGYIGTYKEYGPDNSANEYNHALTFGVTSSNYTGGREVGRFSSGGYFGIGRTVPEYTIDAHDASSGVTTMRLLNAYGLATSNAYGYSRFQGLSGGNGLFLSQNVNGINGGSSVLDSSSHSGFAISMGENYGGWAFLKYAAGAGTVTPTVPMFLTTAGELCIGTTTSGSAALRVRRVNAGPVFYASQEVPTNNTTAAIYQTEPGGNNNQNIGLVVAIQAQGDGDRILTCQYWNSGSPQDRMFVTRGGAVYNTTGTYGTISDVRIKQDITNASSQWEDFKKIKFRKFRLIDAVEKHGNNAPYLMGPVAQELEEAGMKGLVETPVDKDGNETDLHKTVKLSIMYMKGMKALQEAMTRIEQLEARLNAAGI